MSPNEAINRAMAMHPDIPGVGRLCQELLASITGKNVDLRVARQVHFTHTDVSRHHGNPWGRAGKPVMGDAEPGRTIKGQVANP